MMSAIVLIIYIFYRRCAIIYEANHTDFLKEGINMNELNDPIMLILNFGTWPAILEESIK